MIGSISENLKFTSAGVGDLTELNGEFVSVSGFRKVAAILATAEAGEESSDVTISLYEAKDEDGADEQLLVTRTITVVSGETGQLVQSFDVQYLSADYTHVAVKAEATNAIDGVAFLALADPRERPITE
ncbi:hypothetical protein FLK61_35165 [Paenalkalicoccus suaedae]|uniref:Uncharacterized protein n=1 Tax=Paenalkalicoccus suaedae TaxID=2592382 RepID=A0A859FGG5_9BACI|nr:hypothetical protein [Paenalkalicoccus suaedae]QKS71910.1 hypothetical protein FLK61_35165 [Paenalkalicoccus suaedae]